LGKNEDPGDHLTLFTIGQDCAVLHRSPPAQRDVTFGTMLAALAALSLAVVVRFIM
jgi:hypothetical protein